MDIKKYHQGKEPARPCWWQPPGTTGTPGAAGLWPARLGGFVSLSLSALLTQSSAGWGRDRLGGLFTVCTEIVKIKEGFE